ncbi:MAG: arginine--tRNA ligase [bacterium]|nr:arginine--tRNA ligase [bacterium]
MRNKIIALLRNVIEEDIEIVVSSPENYAFGHYSTSVAFSLAKIWKMSPTVAAEKLKEKIIAIDKDKLFKEINVVSPGFINFWISSDKLEGEFKEILKKKNKYGKPSSSKGVRLPKIQVEFISANPTGPLTMANGRGGFLGDVLSNILEFTGKKVEREYYVNDTGNQIITLGKSLLASIGLIADEEKFYKGGYIKTWALKNKAFIKKNQKNPLLIGKKAAKELLANIKKVIIKKSGIKFDRFTSEDSQIHKKDLIKKTLEIFSTKGLIYDKEGAKWLKTTEFGDDKDRVLITSDGFPTYFLADAGHLLETKTRGFSNKILILGPDHYGYVARVKAAAKIIGLANFETLITQAVRIIKDGVEVKMSKRKGEFITFEEVVDKVGVDAARFFFLMHAPESHMDFDLKLAKERSVKNPVYYIQYAYVRCGAILQKVKSQKSKVKIESKNLESLKSEVSEKLTMKLIKFPEIIEDIQKDYQVHRLTRYASELSHIFHNFYEKERIIGETNINLIYSRIMFIEATQIVLGGVLNLLGISKPKKM